MHDELYVLDLGPANAGLSDLRARVLDSAGTNVGSEITTGFIELGNGKYQIIVNVPDAEGTVKFYRSGGAASPLLVGTYSTVLATLALVAAGKVAFVSPLQAGGRKLLLVRGDDYAGSTALVWQETAGNWPDLDGIVRLGFEHRTEASAPKLQVEGVVTQGTGPTKTITFELTAAQTATLLAGDKAYYFDIDHVSAGNKTTTLVVNGECSVVESFTTSE